MTRGEAQREAAHRAAEVIDGAMSQGWPDADEFGYEPRDAEAVVKELDRIVKRLRFRAAAP